MTKALNLFLIILMFAGSAGSVTATSEQRGGQGHFLRASKPVKGEYIVVLDRDIRAPEVGKLATSLAARFEGQLRSVITDAANAFHVEMTEQKARALAHVPGVLLVEENGYWEIAASTSDWHLDRIDQISGLNSDYSPCFTGAGVTAYVVDTGVAQSHDEFQLPGGASLYRELTDPHVDSVQHVINGLVLTDYDLQSGRPEWEGIPVIVSANNHDGSACDYSPSRMAWNKTELQAASFPPGEPEAMTSDGIVFMWKAIASKPAQTMESVWTCTRRPTI
ncbi:MAG TPA: hypothetical protein VM557_09320 [Thermoanaerobaculia bacterium]|nr:hypothetical protein [Thermoanaerobaculia bacterium]